MIRSQCDCFYGIFTLYFFFLSSLVLHTRASPVIQHCPYDQRDALLDFKHELSVNESNSNSSDSLLNSWNKTSDDCCSWEGVTCDVKSTKVISLYLDSIPLKSSLKLDSGLFRLQHLRNLTLRNCSLYGNIPSSLGNLSRLTVLDLTENNLVGQVPSCLWGLERASFSHNSFNSFENSSQVFDETRIIELDLSSNSFQGPIPYNICKLRSLRVLDLSNNNFNGSISQCLKNTTTSIEEFILSSNNFSGALPDIFSNATSLKSFDVSHNRLEGKLPKSLINSKAIKLVNVQCNRIKDNFPYWLGSLPLLNVLLLRTNQLYGTLHHFHASKGFQRLRVFDISHNHFGGTLSYLNFSDWYEMATITTTDDDDTYMENHLYAGGVYRNSMKMIHKRVDTEFERIRKDFKAMDFSDNKFYGNIPESIGLLKELRLLNLSGNEFTSNIPQSLANLKNLEILDLSSNQLSGQIPQGLSSLSFLSTMDFSHNNLQGPIPRSTQFRSQNCSSFMDNPKLHGFDETCEKIHVPNLTPEPLEESQEQVINWIAAAIAYGPGFFCGFVIGYIFVSYKHKWFYGTFFFVETKPELSLKLNTCCLSNI